MSTGAWSNGPDGRRGAGQGAASPAQNDPEDVLNKLFSDTVGNNLEKLTFKPSGGAPPTKTTGSGKTGTMGNGKDFFADLRKQVQSLVEKEKAGG